MTVLARAAKAVVMVLSLVLVGWFAFDAFLNTAVTVTLVTDGPAAAENLLPRYAYRYHALVGASYAMQGDDLLAENELIQAQVGYCDIPLWNNLGHVQAKMHKWREACEAYEKWARCGLDHSDSLLNLSIAYEQTGRLREAADALVKRNALWVPQSTPEIKRLAVLQSLSGEPGCARDTLNLYRKMWMRADARTVAEIENLSGGIALALGDRTNAEACFRSALSKEPGLQSARRNLDTMQN